MRFPNERRYAKPRHFCFHCTRRRSLASLSAFPIPSVFPFLSLLLLSLPLPSASLAVQCYERVEMSLRNSTPQNPNSFNLLSETKACAEQLATAAGPEGYESWPACGADLITVEIAAHSIIPRGINVLPYADTNISVLVHSSAARVIFIRLHCTLAYDGDDSYCNGHDDMIRKWGKVIYPCRGLELVVNAEDVQLPYLYTFDCFRLFQQSHYYVNVTVLPQKCISTLFFTSPYLIQYFPDIADYYDHRSQEQKNVTPLHHEWSPLLILDLTSSHDGVWLRFTVPQGVHWSRMTLSLHGLDNNTITAFQKKFLVYAPDRGVKWSNAEAGSYALYGYVVRGDCELLCGGRVNCHQCKHTHLNFTLYRHYSSLPHRVFMLTRDVGPFVLLAVFLIFLVTVVAGAIYMHLLTKKASKTVHDIPLIRNPDVLLMYSDDFDEHTAAVGQLCTLLRRTANVRVLMDAEELLKIGVRPSGWLLDTLCRVERVALVLSPATPLLMAGERQLKQRRPFPDQFMLAVNIIIQESAQDMAVAHAVDGSPPSSASSALPSLPGGLSLIPMRFRVCIIRFPYSPPVPSQLTLLGVPCFVLPEDLVKLIGFLHGVAASDQTSMPSLTSSSLYDWETAIHASNNFLALQSPQWLMERTERILSPGEVAKEQMKLVKSLVKKEEKEAKTIGEEGLSAERCNQLGLVPLDDSEEEAETETAGVQDGLLKGKKQEAYELLPPDSDSD